MHISIGLFRSASKGSAVTVHIAIANHSDAVLFSDSQGSTNVEESHGFHKQYVGENFIVGAAGHGGIIMNLFDALNGSIGPSASRPADEVCSEIEQFLTREVRPKYWDTVEILLLAPHSGSCFVKSFLPGLFSRFGKSSKFATSGSGSEFVDRATSRHRHLGIDLPNKTLADLLTTTTYFADVANESLTVDDLLTVAVISSDRSYLLGEFDVRVNYGPSQLLLNWKDASAHWNKIRAMTKQINGEVREAQRAFNAIRTGDLIPPMLNKIDTSNTAIDKLRNQLETAVSEFKQWYDILVGRTSSP